ncbi:unnamed protein product [Amoebophrya sp. A120]|nr:unnamed protein product [Amoebophrya sp. A120]|eukprot:GSA120T00016458001.1
MERATSSRMHFARMQGRDEQVSELEEDAFPTSTQRPNYKTPAYPSSPRESQRSTTAAAEEECCITSRGEEQSLGEFGLLHDEAEPLPHVDVPRARGMLRSSSTTGRSSPKISSFSRKISRRTTSLFSTAALFFSTMTTQHSTSSMMGGSSSSFMATTFVSAQSPIPDLSLPFPVSHHLLDDSWHLKGTAHPQGDDKCIILGVGVPGRAGYLWSKNPSPSNDVEISFKFSVTTDPQTTNIPHKQGFAFWFVEDPDATGKHITDILGDPVYMRTQTLGLTLNKVSRDVMAYRSKWNGLGVLFTPRTVEYQTGSTPISKSEQAIVAAVNDGTKSLYTNGDIPSALAKKVNFRNMPGHMHVKIRVTPNNVKVEIGEAGKNQYTVLLDENKSLPKNAVLGFTTFTDDEAVDYTGGHRDFDTTRLWELEVKNFDQSVKVQERKVQSDKPGEDMHGDFLYEHGALKEHREESAAIHQLTNMVMKLIAETEPVRREMERTVLSLSQRVISLEKIFGELKQEINQKTGHDLDKEFDDIKAELVQLSQTANSETERRKEKMQALHDDLEQMRGSTMGGALEKLTETNNAVLESLSSGHQWSLFISLCAVGIILLAGLALYQRFRNWEKKHIL